MELKPRYKLTEVGVIPADWEVVAIGEIAKFTSGAPINVSALRRRSAEYSVPVFGGNGIAGYTREALTRFPTVVVGRVGQRCGAVYLSDGPAWVSDNALYPQRICRPMDMRFLALALELAGLNEARNRNDLPLVTQAIVHSVRIAWPSDVSEQRAIAAALSDVDALLSALDMLVAKKRAIRQTAAQQLLTGQRRLPGFHGVWGMKRLGDVVENVVGGGTPSRSNPDFWGDEIPWVTVKDLSNFDPRRSQESVTRRGLENSASHLIPKGTVIAATRMALGKAVRYEVDVCINQDLKALFPRPCLSSHFLYHWFQYNGSAIEELGSGSTVKGVPLLALKCLEFLLPPLDEQSAIAAVLSDMDAEVATLEARVAKTRALKQGMLQELLTGATRLV